MNILDFKTMKERQEKISMLTCYDYPSACIMSASDIDCVLVGDSCAMVMHGYPSTIHANIDMMCYHISAVAKGLQQAKEQKFLIADLPFLSYRKSLELTMNAVEQCMRAGAQAVKLEGAIGNEKIIRHLRDSGIPVMGHIGLQPQAVHSTGGHRLQGKTESAAEKLKQQAALLEEAGCFAIVLECIPSRLAQEITEQLSIPTIGIGAGVNTDGQVLVLQDMLGFNKDFSAKFLKKYMAGHEMMLAALNTYNSEVKQRQFPNEATSY